MDAVEAGGDRPCDRAGLGSPPTRTRSGGSGARKGSWRTCRRRRTRKRGHVDRTAEGGPGRCARGPGGRRGTRRRVVLRTGRRDPAPSGNQDAAHAESGPEPTVAADRPPVRPISKDGGPGPGAEGFARERGGGRLRPRGRCRPRARGRTGELRDARTGGPVLFEARDPSAVDL